MMLNKLSLKIPAFCPVDQHHNCKGGFSSVKMTNNFSTKYISAWALTFTYSFSGEIFLF